MSLKQPQSQQPQPARLYDAYPATLAALATATEAALCERLCADETEYEQESVLRNFRRVALATLASVSNSSHATTLGPDFVEQYVAERLYLEADALAENARLRRDATRRSTIQQWQGAVEAHYRQQRQMHRWQPAR